VFILYAVVIGLALGFLAGGRLEGLARIDFRWPWVAITGFFVQVLLFSDAVGAAVGSAGPPIYVASTAAVLVAVLRNVAIPGLAVVAVGAASNLLAIVTNGGFMPASEGAFAALGQGLNSGYTNSSIVESPAFQPLTDVYAMPAWMPLANVFSVGDVLIAAGVVMVLVVGMRTGRGVPAVSAPPSLEPSVADAVPSPASPAEAQPDAVRGP
jgi:hypothetical protein